MKFKKLLSVGLLVLSGMTAISQPSYALFKKNGDNKLVQLKGSDTILSLSQSVAEELTIDVLVPATFKEENKQGVFAGSFTIRRGDFAIGEGSWSTFDIVANDIQIKFTITATSSN
jgi:YceI-like domain.